VPRAKIVPCFPSGTLKLRRTTVDGGRASLASPGRSLTDQIARIPGRWSWLRFAVPSRIARPWTPAGTKSSPGGGCRRYDCEDKAPQLNRSGAFTYAQTLRWNCCFPVYRIWPYCNWPKPAHTGRIRPNCTATGSRITRNLLTIARTRRRVKLCSENFQESRTKRVLFPQATEPSFNGEDLSGYKPRASQSKHTKGGSWGSLPPQDHFRPC